MALIDTAGNLITLGVAYSITKDMIKPRRKKRKTTKKKKKR